jgi:hypothetical protein
MTEKRRNIRGIALVTTAARASDVKQLCAAASLPARVLAVQEGLTWPEVRPPIVLDTIAMPLEMLIALLANPPLVQKVSVSPLPGARAAQAKAASAAQAMLLEEHTEPMPLGVLADPDDWRTLRLLPLCPSVRMVSSADQMVLRRWVRHLGSVLAPRQGANSLVWLFEPPPPVPTQLAVDQAEAMRALRDPLLLRVLAALPSSPSYTIVAMRCKVSTRTLSRTLRAVRSALDLPPGDVSRFSPAELAALIFERLGIDSPATAKHQLG